MVGHPTMVGGSQGSTVHRQALIPPFTAWLCLFDNELRSFTFNDNLVFKLFFFIKCSLQFVPTLLQVFGKSLVECIQHF